MGTHLTYVGSSEAADFPSNLDVPNQKLMTGLNQNGRRNRLFDPGDVVKLSQKLPILVVA